MTIAERTALVLQQVEERIARPMLGARERTALRCLKTALEGMLKERDELLRSDWEADGIDTALTTLCDQFQKAGR